jgi:hypothetical protein
MDPEELDYETDWAPEGSWGYQIGVEYKLGKCTPSCATRLVVK